MELKQIIKIMINFFSKILKPFIYLNDILGYLSLIIIMLTISLDVILRFIFSISIPGHIDIISILLILVFFSGLADAEKNERHIRIDLITSKLPETYRNIILAQGDFLTFITVVIVFMGYSKYSLFLFKSHIYSSVLKIPEWIFVLLSTFFFFVFFIALLINLLKRLQLILESRMSYNKLSVLLAGFFLVICLVMLSLFPNLLPSGIPRAVWGGIVLILLFVLMFLGVHIFAVMALVSLLGFNYLTSLSGSLNNLVLGSLNIAHNYTWSVAPLFIWLGSVVLFGGFAKSLYIMAYTWIGNIPGGLASATAVACAGLGAVTGNAISGVMAMGEIAIEEMKKYKYDLGFSSAVICSASPICSLIPPSFTFILYGMIVEVSVGKLFLAGLLPGLLLMLILISLITFLCIKDSQKGPRGPKYNFREKIYSLKRVWPIIFLFLVVMLSIYLGIATPSEAAGLGVFTAILLTFIMKQMTFNNFLKSMKNTLLMMATIFSILCFAIAFGRFLAASGLPNNLADFVISFNLSKITLISLILFVYMFLGCIMNFVPALLITLPMFFPVAMEAGFNPIWFGVLIVIMNGLAQITPPIGMNVFAMSSIARDVPIYTIFKNIIPFWIAYIILLIILVLFPTISLLLPNIIM